MNNLRNLTVPFNVPIPGGMTSGKMVVVQGKIPSMSRGFAVKLLTQSGDIALHVEPNFKENIIIRNNLIKGNWGPEESIGGMPMRPNQLFEIFIECSPYDFKITINEEHFCEFSHRLPFNTITNLAVDGQVLVHNVSFKDKYGNNNNNDLPNSESYGIQPGASSKNYKPSALYPTIDSNDFPSIPNSRHSPSPSAPISGGPLYPTPGGFQYPSDGNRHPSSDGYRYSSGGNTYPGNRSPQYPSGGNLYPGSGGSSYPSGGAGFHTSGGGPQYPSGGGAYPTSSGGSKYPQGPSLYPTQPSYPSNPYPQVPSSNTHNVSPTPHSRPGFLDQAGAALAGVLGPALLSGSMNRGSATHGKPNLLDEAGRALAGVIGGAGLAGTGKPVRGTDHKSPTPQSGFLDQAGTALAGILGGSGLIGQMGRPQARTTQPSPTHPSHPGSILDQAGSALAGILGGGGLTGAGRSQRGVLPQSPTGHPQSRLLDQAGSALAELLGGGGLSGNRNNERRSYH